MRLLESKYSFLAFFFVLIISCNNHRDKGNISETSYSLSDFAECDLEVFTPNENITVILDSVIENTIQCERYTNLPLGFLFESYIDNQENHIITISNIVDIHEFYYEQCSGLFYYRGYQFSLIGDIISEFFIPQERRNKVLYIALGKEKDINVRGEFFNSSWSYLVKKGNLTSYHYTYCGEHWDSVENSD